MMPLTLANTGEEQMIRKVGGNAETKKFLENLGFVAGSTVIIISEIGGTVGDIESTPFKSGCFKRDGS